MAADKPNMFLKKSQERKQDQDKLVSSAKNTDTVVVAAEQPTTTKGKQGRPCIDETKGKKKDYCKTINIAVPKEVLDKINTYALEVRGVNLTEYINLLIDQDLDRNLEKYKKELKRNVTFD